MDEKPKKTRPAERGMEVVKVSLPSEQAAQLRKLAQADGITVQSLCAPILNAVARGEVRREYVMPETSTRKAA